MRASTGLLVVEGHAAAGEIAVRSVGPQRTTGRVEAETTAVVSGSRSRP